MLTSMASRLPILGEISKFQGYYVSQNKVVFQVLKPEIEWIVYVALYYGYLRGTGVSFNKEPLN